MNSLTIGSVTIPSRCFLAPLAGISDLSFRMLNRRFGCRFAFVEMSSAKSVLVQTKMTKKLLKADPADRPLGIQLVGKDGDDLRRALEVLEPYGFDIIDFNAACPVRKVVRRNEGASLLNDPQKLTELIKVLVKYSAAPVTLKIRSGWDAHSINAPEIARRAEDAGVQAVTIHGRTRAQLYKGRVRYESIREVKEAVTIPVIGSGDVFSPWLAKKMLDETGCDGVAIARGSFGNPWIFEQTEEYLARGTEPRRPGLEEIMETMLRHLAMSIELQGERNGVVLFRKFFSWYTKGFRHIKPLRARAFTSKTEEEMIGVINELPGLKGARDGPYDPQYPWAGQDEE